MYRAQHFRLQNVGGRDDDTFVSEIVPEVCLHPGGVATYHRVFGHEELDVVEFFPPEVQSRCADTIYAEAHQQPQPGSFSNTQTNTGRSWKSHSFLINDFHRDTR